MPNYREHPDALKALVQDRRVHRDLYLNQEVFQLEQERFFARTWQYAGHASEIPQAGDFRAIEIAGRPLLMVRQANGSIGVFYNRCAHKGAQLVTDEHGNVGRFFKCPYHAWTYKLDGAPLAIPLKAGYENTGLAECESGRGLTPVAGVGIHRDFVFVRLSAEGASFDDYFGEILQVIDNLVDRSPQGRLTVVGGVLRNVVHCNWKMYLENINDTVHPMSTHESATQAAAELWKDKPADAPKPMAMEQILPFGNGYDFFDQMGGRVYRNGHSVLGTRFSIHSGYARLEEYEAALRAALGDERADDVLQRSPQNAVLFPSLSVKGSPQAIRVIRPLSADRTLIEAWSFRPEAAPEILVQRSMNYNRLVFSPMSVVAHDDVHLFESMQQGLRGEGNEWVSLHRGWSEDEAAETVRETNGTNELLIRNQFRAWARWMGESA